MLQVSETSERLICKQSLMNNSVSWAVKKIYTNICFYLALNNELDFWTEWQCRIWNTCATLLHQCRFVKKKHMFLKCPVQLLSEFSLNLFFSFIYDTESFCGAWHALSLSLCLCHQGIKYQINSQPSVCKCVCALFLYSLWEQCYFHPLYISFIFIISLHSFGPSLWTQGQTENK